LVISIFNVSSENNGTEQVIFRLLGVSKSLEEKFLLNQYNRGTEI